MDIPLELSFHNIESSDALKAAVREHVNKLEKFHDHIIGCRVVIEMPHRSQKASGNPPDVHIVIRVPGKEIVISRELAHNGHKKAATDAYAVLDRAFLVAQKQLKDHRPDQSWRCEAQGRRSSRRPQCAGRLERSLHRRTEQRHLSAPERNQAIRNAKGMSL